MPDEQCAAAQANANARLDGTALTDAEQRLIARRRAGEISQDEFLTAAAALATWIAEETP